MNTRVKTDEEIGRRFRELWVNGVKKHFSGVPKPAYISAWQEMPDWEKKAAIAVYKRALAFMQAGPAQLSPEQGGRFICEAWNVEVFRHIEKPKASYTMDWDQLTAWHQLTNIDIYQAIEKENLLSHLIE